MKLYRSMGFTLIEISIATGLLAILIGVISAYWYYVQQNYEFSMSEYQLIDRANQTVRQIANEVRQAREAMNGAYPLAQLDDNQLVFYADINGDGNVERCRYYILNGTLKRGVVNATGNPPGYDLATEKITSVVDSIDVTQTPLFTYYNSNWPGDPTHNPLVAASRPLETRLINIMIPIVIKDSNGTHTYRTNATVQIRNLKNNW